LLQFSRNWFSFCERWMSWSSKTLCVHYSNITKKIYTPIMQTTPNLFVLLYQLNWRHLCWSRPEDIQSIKLHHQRSSSPGNLQLPSKKGMLKR
jgi:hypothetical protein